MIGKERRKKVRTVHLPEQVKFIISEIEKAGFEAYAVGGCVRDTILEREPSDWDITTSAKPEAIKSIFSHTIDTGIQHGTVTVMLEKNGYEVTTYRIDGEYEDNRHPKNVIFTPNLIEDLKRRDFTINAMAYSEKKGLVDEFDGIGDIERKVIRCVGNPYERFSEDALRIMRAVRFAAQLGYEIEDQTREAMKELSPNLKDISAERINVELTKLLISNHPDYIRDAYELGITKVIFPEFDEAMKTEQNHPHHCYTVGEHTLHALTEVENDKVLRYTLLFHDMGKPATRTTDEEGLDHFYGHAELSSKMANDICRRLKFDNDSRTKIVKLVKYHDLKIEETERAVRRAVAKVGEDLFPLLLKVKRADMLAKSDYKREENQRILAHIEALYHGILEKQQCLSLKTLAVTGKDLLDNGMQPGKEVGETLGRLLDMVLEDPEKNTKEYLLKQI